MLHRFAALLHRVLTVVQALFLTSVCTSIS